MDGSNHDSSGLYEDAELVACGLMYSWNTTDVDSNMTLQLEDWNGHNFQQVSNAYNFGEDTAEGIDNATSSSYAFASNGSLAARLTAGPGSLGKLYDQSQVSTVSFAVPFSSGTLYISNGGSPFSNVTANSTGYTFEGQEVNVTLSPGTYTFYLYTNKMTLERTISESLVAGKCLAVNLGSYPTLTGSSNANSSSTTIAQTISGSNGSRAISSSEASTCLHYIASIDTAKNDNDGSNLLQQFASLRDLGVSPSSHHHCSYCNDSCFFETKTERQFKVFLNREIWKAPKPTLCPHHCSV